MGPRARAVLAVLAGGTVLAGGCVTTLASWQDETNDQVPLRLTKFSLQQTVDTVWTGALPSTAPGTIDLSVTNATGLLTPGGSVYAWVGLRVAADSIGGTVTMSGATVGTDPGLAPLLTYQAAAGVPKDQCRAGGTAGTPLVPASSPLTTAASATFHLDAGTSTTPGTAVGVCMKLTLQDGISKTLAGQAVSPVWKFSAVSDG